MNTIITILFIVAGIIALLLIIALFMKRNIIYNAKLSSMRRGKSI